MARVELIGPMGAGKTSLAALAAGLTDEGPLHKVIVRSAVHGRPLRLPARLPRRAVHVWTDIGTLTERNRVRAEATGQRDYGPYAGRALTVARAVADMLRAHGVPVLEVDGRQAPEANAERVREWIACGLRG